MTISLVALGLKGSLKQALPLILILLGLNAPRLTRLAPNAKGIKTPTPFHTRPLQRAETRKKLLVTKTTVDSVTFPP